MAALIIWLIYSLMIMLGKCCSLVANSVPQTEEKNLNTEYGIQWGRKEVDYGCDIQSPWLMLMYDQGWEATHQSRRNSDKTTFSVVQCWLSKSNRQSKTHKVNPKVARRPGKCETDWDVEGYRIDCRMWELETRRQLLNVSGNLRGMKWIFCLLCGKLIFID